MDIERLVGNPESVRVSSVREENRRARTLFFPVKRRDVKVQPGQFFMIWVPGVDEVPMSVSFWESPHAGVTVLPVGEATQALVSMSKGQYIGVRGPFGNHFEVQPERALVVGGGIGMAALRLLVYSLFEVSKHVTLLMAARTADDLIFVDEFTKLARKGLVLKLATDDGSAGFKGLASDAAESIISKSDFDIMYTCGPELMMVELCKIAYRKGIQIQASLERFMKCGCGICGSCALDTTGDLVCLDGPVFSWNQLAKISEFGNYCRDSTGAKKPLQHTQNGTKEVKPRGH